ncbi:hypothetical protein [Haladaptatus sp. DFWS20]|uniref:hypothetical protein n=1 Tax=Haladaptatus sp. DFWS20 TaxID=3403467 RepID=UPI003EC05BC7
MSLRANCPPAHASARYVVGYNLDSTRHFVARALAGLKNVRSPADYCARDG